MRKKTSLDQQRTLVGSQEKKKSMREDAERSSKEKIRKSKTQPEFHLAESAREDEKLNLTSRANSQ